MKRAMRDGIAAVRIRLCQYAGAVHDSGLFE